MKLTKILPVILLVLVLAWLFLPGTDNATPAPTPTEALTLVSPSPSAAPTPASPSPTSAPTPSSGRAETPKPLPTRTPAPSPEPTGKALDVPENFIEKREAEALGWDGGNLNRVLPGMCIGGDYFGNYEGLLPKAKGRRWTECDVDTLGARSRGEKRIVFSTDGLIYYTEDHYESFELLYDGW